MAIITETIDGKIIEVNIASSNLKKAKYDTEKKELTITFMNNSIYVYNDVPWEIFVRLRLAESQGKYFNENIAKKYTYKKIS